MTVVNTLADRATTHGEFSRNAELTQALKKACNSYAVQSLSDVQQEALDNICQKMARILTGNPNHADNWHDIAGYAMLAERELTDETV
jgi:hypothetical protein